MKHFINDRSAIVTEAIDLFVLLGDGKIACLDSYPSIKVVVRTDWDRATGGVAIISGGGSGHEPAHAGFVGDGMLTAAVCGEIFASPSVDAVLAAIVAVTGPAGCLLIVKSYTGDRLNFGLAAEKARAIGLDVEMVIVGDDIALPHAVHPRGIAGTLFVHKVAGHLARSGASLAKVKAVAESVAKATASIGLSLSSGTIPGQPTENRIGPNEVELGLGIHGEPGASIIAMSSARDLATTMVTALEPALSKNESPLALLINDLGGVPPLEMAVATHALLDAMSSSKNREIALVIGPARLMTSLDMKGLSLSVLPILNEEIESALLSEVGPHAWPRASRVQNHAPIPMPSSMKRALYTQSSNAARRGLIEKACTTLIALESDLNLLDAKVGDGDTGTTFATGARAVLAAMDDLPLDDASALCMALSDRLSLVMGGSSGILLAIFFAAMGTSLKERSGGDFIHALRDGVTRVQVYGGAREGDRTMLDALIPAIAALEVGGDLDAASAAAHRGAEATAAMKIARAGRSSYVREEALRGVRDPGAVAIAALFGALVTIRTA